MLTKYLALISESSQVGNTEVAQIAAAIQKQITRDFTPIWNVPATISSFGKLEDVPSDYWSIIVKDNIGVDGAAGIHLDRNGQPYALVLPSEATSLTCSHEVIEMLVDPFGNRLVASQSLKVDQGRVNYLVEACDPSEAYEFGYQINGMQVSDFYTPNFFDPVYAPSVRYSFTGCITKPRQVLEGGYISWMIPATGEWFQAKNDGEITIESAGFLTKEDCKSWREIIDARTAQPLKKILEAHSLKGANLSTSLLTASFRNNSSGWAKRLREDIEKVISKGE